MQIIIYVVLAYRYGNHEKHSYLVGAFFDEEKALNTANAEEKFRGGKYSCEVLKVSEGDYNFEPVVVRNLHGKIME